MNKLFISAVCLLFSQMALSQQDYSIAAIPKELTQHASVVKRFEQMKLIVKDIGKAKIKYHYAVTILNASGDHAAVFSEGYSKLRTLTDIEGRLYDASGKKLKSVKKSEIQDYSDIGEGTFADDDRMKLHSFNYNGYPYTVEYEYEVVLKGLLYFPGWVPVAGSNYSVQESKLIVECPKGYSLRYKAHNYNGSPVESADKESKYYEWSVKNIPAREYLANSPPWYKITPTVFLAPTEFEMEDYKGNMSSWQGFGKFIFDLNLGRDLLPEDIKQKVRSMTAGLPDNKSRIEALYQYLQKTTHYVGVQLGIGGWQTFDAAYVAKKGYGDCKALSNYMYSMLKEIGIKSYYTLIYSGKDAARFDADFPSNQFNHIIICVPEGKDTTWLECTSQTLPAGYLSTSTSHRPALLIDESGGKIVNTPRYDKSVNLQQRKLTGSITSEGQLKTKINTRYVAWQQESLHGMLSGMSKARVHEYLKKELDLPSYDIDNFHYEEHKASIPAIVEKLELTVNNYVTKTGKRLFVQPNVMNRWQTIYDDEERKIDIQISNGFTDVDTVEIDIPLGYKTESFPAENHFETIFGKYDSKVELKPGKLLYYRRMERNEGIFPASSYKDLVTFYNKIHKADRAKLVLVKEE